MKFNFDKSEYVLSTRQFYALKVFSYVLQEVESEQQKPFKDYLDKNATVLEEAVKKIDAETIGKVKKDTEICQQKNDIINESVDKEMLDRASSSCKVEIIEYEEKINESNQSESDVKVCDDEHKVQEEASVEDDAEKPLVEF